MSGDYIDYTLLAKKGLLKVKQPESSTVKYDKDGYIQLDQAQPDSSIVSTPTETTAPTPSFFDTPAMPSTSPAPSFGGFFDSSPSSPAAETSVYSNNSSEHDVSFLKTKVDSIEYKLDSLLRKIEDMESRLMRG